MMRQFYDFCTEPHATRKRFQRVLIVILLVLGVAPTNAQSGTVIVRPLAEVLDALQNTVPETITLAPDGEQIAYLTQAELLCVYRLDDDSTTCIALPETFLTLPTRLYWSPESTRVAFTETVNQPTVDADIWLWDVRSETVTNLTDDGAIRAGENAPLDYSPFWSPDDTLYFLRSAPIAQPALGVNADLQLMRFTGDGVETVRDLTGELPALTIVNLGEWTFFDDAISVSTDGERAALVVIDPSNIVSETSGIYILALDGDSAPQRVAPILLDAGLPAWAVLDPSLPPYLVRGVGWAGDDLLMGTAHLFSFNNPDLLPYNLYRLDLISETVLPRLDYRLYDTQAAYTTARDSGFPDGAFVPNYATLIDDDTLLALTLTPVGGILWSASVDGDTIEVLWRDDRLDADTPLIPVPPSVSADGTRVLINDLLVSLSGTE